MNAFEKGVTKLLIAQLSELYFCENQLVHALERMAQAASNQELKDLLLGHRQETLGHIDRLESAFYQLNETPRVYPCRVVEGLLEEGTWLMRTMKGEPTLDVALIEAAHKTEMLETASYRSAIRLARQLGHENVAQLCESNMDEELMADEKLTQLSKHFEGEHA
jgi:ferritin-like metal-binding protein YciE